MASAIDQALSPKRLKSAFGAIYSVAKPAARATTGVDGISLEDFRRQSSLIGELHKKLISQQFVFSPLRPFLIPKANGKDRLICVPTVSDRIVQKALLSFLSVKYRGRLHNEISYGFVEGRSVKQAAARAIELRQVYPWVFKTDITSFFDKIPRETLKDKYRSLIKDSSLYPLLDSAINCEIMPASGGIDRRIKKLGIKKGLGVRQGMPLSPFFSNVLLRGFDARIISNNWKCVRYADDLIFFAESEEEANIIGSECKSLLSELDLEIPSISSGSKSQIYAPQQPAEFLGLDLVPLIGVYSLRLSATKIDKIVSGFELMGSVKELLSRGIGLGKLNDVLLMRKNGYLAAYDVCENVGDLQQALDAAIFRVLKNIYSKDLQIPVNKLSKEAKAFLFGFT